MKALFLNGYVSLSMEPEGIRIRQGDKSQVISPPYLPYDTILIQNAHGYISFHALRILTSLKVSIALLDFQGRLMAHMVPYDRRTGALEMKQFLAASNPKKRLAIAKRIVTEGYRRRGMNPSFSEAKTPGELLRMEAQVASTYWDRWKVKLAEAWPEHDFDRRQNPMYTSRVRAVNRVNAVLNYSYALLESACRTVIRRVGLVPEIGFLHQENTYSIRAGEPFVWDMEELGRAWVDSAILDWFRKPENRKGFIRNDEWIVRLVPEKRQELIDFVTPRIKSEVLWHDAREVVSRL